MIVNPNVSLVSVVENFDLTFCQIYYDGSTVEAMHINDVKNKKGVLRDDYTETLLRGNTFTLYRLSKYQSRGFSITITIGRDLITIKKTDPESWVVRLIY